MRRQFTIQSSEVSQYLQDGFLIKRRFIPKPLIDQSLESVETLLKRINSAHEPLNSVVYREKKPFLIGDIPWLEPELIPLLASLNLWGGASVLLKTARLTYHYSSLIIRQPQLDSRVNWHRDFNNHYIAPVTSDYLRVFIPLTPSSRKNGGPIVAPGSHKIPDRAVSLVTKPSPTAFPRWHLLEGAIGDVIFLHPKTLHCSSPNQSEAPRTNLVIQLAKAQCPVHDYPYEEKYSGDDRLQLVHHASK